MISPGLLLIVVGAFGVFLLLVHVIGAVSSALDQRRMHRHKEQVAADRLAIERERTARAWLERGQCPACGAPAEEGTS